MGPRDVALLRLAYDLALRIGELAPLDVADVEQKTGGLWIFGKGRKARELVTMPQTSREAVRDCICDERDRHISSFRPAL
jgi:integrase/recombinase XerC